MLKRTQWLTITCVGTSSAFPALLHFSFSSHFIILLLFLNFKPPTLLWSIHSGMYPLSCCLRGHVGLHPSTQTRAAHPVPVPGAAASSSCVAGFSTWQELALSPSCSPGTDGGVRSVPAAFPLHSLSVSTPFPLHLFSIPSPFPPRSLSISTPFPWSTQEPWCQQRLCWARSPALTLSQLPTPSAAACPLQSKNQPHRRGEYNVYSTFQSHEPEFDYLKSLEIEEKINKIRWLPQQNAAYFLLSTNGVCPCWPLLQALPPTTGQSPPCGVWGKIC